MSKTKSSKDVAHMSKTENNFWDKAILEAENQIKEAKKKIANLKKSIETFKDFRESGEPFLGGNSEQNEAKS